MSSAVPFLHSARATSLIRNTPGRSAAATCVNPNSLIRLQICRVNSAFTASSPRFLLAKPQIRKHIPAPANRSIAIS